MLTGECKTIIMAISGPRKEKKSVKHASQMCSKNNCVLDYETFNSMITGSSLVTQSGIRVFMYFITLARSDFQKVHVKLN